MIYLDNASTTRMTEEVLEEMMPYLKDEYGNPGTTYELGRNAKEAIEKARKRVADFMGADPKNIIFTSGGTESNNTIVRSFIKTQNKMLISRIEHDSILRSAGITSDWCPTSTDKIKMLGVNEAGVIDMDEFYKDIETGSFGFVSVMYMNNETGMIQPVHDIYNLCKDKGIWVHSDCVQAAGCLKLNVGEFCDSASISAHKIHGPKGVGALYVKDLDRFPFSPMIYGGHSQEFGYRGGTENVPGIVGLGKACDIINSNEEITFSQIKSRKRLMWAVMQKEFADVGLLDRLHLNCDNLDQFGKTLSVRIDGVDAETMVILSSIDGVCISAGSACRSSEQEPSYVLTSMGLTDDQARNTIRVSVSKYTSVGEIRDGASIIAKNALRLISMSNGIV